MTGPKLKFEDGPLVKPYEYFCFGCGECCLSIVGKHDGSERDDCANCGSQNIVKAEPGELNLPALQFAREQGRRLHEQRERRAS